MRGQGPKKGMGWGGGTRLKLRVGAELVAAEPLAAPAN